MLRGCQKKVVVLKDTGSDMFEEAYFIVKPEIEKKSDFDIISEATKIISESSFKIEKGHKKIKFYDIIPFALGILLGVLTSIAIYLTI